MNSISVEEFERHWDAAHLEWERRSALDWRINFAPYLDRVILCEAGKKS